MEDIDAYLNRMRHKSAPTPVSQPASKSKPGSAPRKKKSIFRQVLGKTAGGMLKDTGLLGQLIVKKISEEAPTNCASSGEVQGLGGSSGEPGVKKKKGPLLSYGIFARKRRTTREGRSG